MRNDSSIAGMQMAQKIAGERDVIVHIYERRSVPLYDFICIKSFSAIKINAIDNTKI